MRRAEDYKEQVASLLKDKIGHLPHAPTLTSSLAKSWCIAMAQANVDPATIDEGGDMAMSVCEFFPAPLKLINLCKEISRQKDTVKQPQDQRRTGITVEERDAIIKEKLVTMKPGAANMFLDLYGTDGMRKEYARMRLERDNQKNTMVADKEDPEPSELDRPEGHGSGGDSPKVEEIPYWGYGLPDDGS